MARTTAVRTVLNGLPKRAERAQAEAQKALTRGYKATLGLLPPGPRKTVTELAEQIEDAATDLGTRGRKALTLVDKRRKALTARVEKAVTALDRRRARVLKAAEKQRQTLLSAVAKNTVGLVKPLVRRLDIASASELDRLGKRLTVLERKLGARGRRAA